MTMNDDLLRVGILLNAAGVPYRIFEKLHNENSLNEIYDGENFWNEIGLTFPQQKKLSDLLIKNSFVNKEIERLEKFNAKFITAFDIDYPAKLKDLKNPPIGLYVKGLNKNVDLNFPSAAIVGTRKCSVYGENTAKSIAMALAEAGIIVISGGARGIDTAAHVGSLAVNGKTFAIFGNGLDKIYPNENRNLFEKISENGALISEYPFGTHGSLWTYPERNRIITAMAGRTIIVESPINGGAMITAREAKNLNRELWTVPGRINEEVCAGTNKLLQDKSGVIVNINEFIKEIYGSFGQLNAQLNFEANFEGSEQKKSNSLSASLSDDEKIIYSLLQRQSNRSIDNLIIESGLDLITVQDSIMMLESLGLVISNGGRYLASL